MKTLNLQQRHAGGTIERAASALLNRGSPPKIPKSQRHDWKEPHGLGGGWTCSRCKKPMSQCYGKERYYCGGKS